MGGTLSTQIRFHIFEHHQLQLPGALQQYPEYTSLAAGTPENLRLHNGHSLSRILMLHFTCSPSHSDEVIQRVKERVKTYQKCFPWLPLKVSIPYFFVILLSISVNTRGIFKSPVLCPVHTSNQYLPNTGPQLCPRHQDHEESD